MNAALLMALAAPVPQTLTDEAVAIPAHEWRYKDLTVNQVPVLVRCNFEEISGSGGVRIVLVNAEGLDNWKSGNRDASGAGAFAREGGFTRVVNVPDDYAVIVENGGSRGASVRLRVSLDYSGRSLPRARYVSAGRRVAVILISATVFLAIVGYSAKKLKVAMRR